MVKQSNDSSGSTEQVGAFRDALQSALGGQSQEGAKTAESAGPQRAAGKESKKSKDAKSGKEAKGQEMSDVLQTLLSQTVGASSIDLTAILVRSISPEATGGEKSAGSTQVATVGTKAEGTPQPVPVSTAVLPKGVVLVQASANAAVTTDGDAVAALSGLVKPEVQSGQEQQQPAANVPEVKASAGNAKEIVLPAMSLPVPEKAAVDKTPAAPVKDVPRDAAEVKVPAPAENAPRSADLPRTETAVNDAPQAEKPVLTSRTDNSRTNQVKMQAAPSGETSTPAPKTLQVADAARGSFAPRTVEEAIVKQAVEAFSVSIDRTPAEKESGTRVTPGPVQAERHAPAQVPEATPNSGENATGEQNGKKSSTSSFTPLTKTALSSDRTGPFALSREPLHSSGAPVGTLPTMEATKSSVNELPIPLPRELSRAVIDQVIKGLTITMTETTQELRVTLKPESLGEVVLKMKMEDGRLQAQIDVAQPAVKAAVESQLTDLRQALQDRGIDVQRIDVVASGQSTNVADGQTQRGNTYKQKGGKRHESFEGIDEIPQARSLGYNTLEVIM